MQWLTDQMINQRVEAAMSIHLFSQSETIPEIIWVLRSALEIRIYKAVESGGGKKKKIHGFDYFSTYSSTVLCYALFMPSAYATADICHCWFHSLQICKPLL